MIIGSECLFRFIAQPVFTCLCLGISGFDCRCGNLFCGIHRYSDKHNCPYDYKAEAAAKIRKENPMVVADKIQRIWRGLCQTLNMPSNQLLKKDLSPAFLLKVFFFSFLFFFFFSAPCSFVTLQELSLQYISVHDFSIHFCFCVNLTLLKLCCEQRNTAQLGEVGWYCVMWCVTKGECRRTCYCPFKNVVSGCPVCFCDLPEIAWIAWCFKPVWTLMVPAVGSCWDLSCACSLLVWVAKWICFIYRVRI